MTIFRKDWISEVTFELSAGRNLDGKLIKGETKKIFAIVNPITSSEAIDYKNTENTFIEVYLRSNINLPSTAFFTVKGYMEGKYQVEGLPATWPKGTVIRGRRIKNAQS